MDADVTALEKAFKRLNQSKPELRPHRNRADTLIRWQRQTHCRSGKPENTSFDAHCCKIPLEELKPIKLCEIEIPKIHHGRYLVCRVIGKPVTEIAAHTLIEDLEGDVEEAAFYNFHFKKTDLDWISVGTIFILKEPWLQYSPFETSFLRIESPSDVIFVDPTDEKILDKIGAMKWYEPLSKDAEEWREKANEFFKNGKYEKALFLYDRGIRCNPDLAVLYLNKALTCLKIGAFHDAYDSAKLGLEKGGDRKKALYRLGQAAYGMREWQKAANYFLQVLKEFPENSDASKELERVYARLAEQKTGKFDFKSMFIESKKEKPEMDVADYTGPIEVANIPGKGRGIIATKDIKKGTLLAVSKSVGSGFVKDISQSFFSNENFVGSDILFIIQVLQAIDTVQYLKKNPQRAKEIYGLYAGDSCTVEKEEIPDDVIDAARLEKISALNRFDNNVRDKYDSTHLFILPSYFNHSCLANAFRQFYGDVVVIHACADIEKGEEISIAYISPLDENSIRKKKFDEWKFTCTCKLCEIDSKDEFCAKRYQMVREFKKRNTSLVSLLKEGEEVLKKIRQTYTKQSEFKTVLAQMLVILYRIAFNVEDFLKFFEFMEELTTFVDGYLGYAIDMGHVYSLLGWRYSENGNSVKAQEMYQKALETSFCVDIEHLDMVYP